ncbi:hypothetical protein ACQPVP_11020 [Clostridium nigeriense]
MKFNNEIKFFFIKNNYITTITLPGVSLYKKVRINKKNEEL